ncbi:MAG: o-succinylbenzoate synthase [Dehalococcoidia bacterium]|nr:o-succinylbenzoate synthase [Dehalococcoidia bacterium]
MTITSGEQDLVRLAPANLAAVRWRPFRLPMRHRFEAAHGGLDDRDGVLVELVGADGVTGIGEASPMASIGGGTVAHVLALLEVRGAALLQADPLAALPMSGLGVSALRCAIDVALLDLEGKRRGVSIARLLAQEAAEAVTVNAIIGAGPASEVAAYGREAVACGYRVLKLKVGVASIEEDVARVAALREACPDATIRLDANGAWSEAQAIEALKALHPLAVELLEQPVAAADVEGLARVRANAPLRVAADEAINDPARAIEVIQRKAADFLVLKPMVLGGLRPALALARAAALSGIGAFATTTFDSSIGTAAAAHLAAALPTDAAHGLGTGEHLASDLLSPTLVAHDGWLRVPTEGNGLGVVVATAALEAIATAPWGERTA